jgi:hypothetical protein
MALANQTDLEDFAEAMKELGPALHAYVAERTTGAGIDPRAIAAAFESAAKAARGWCIGRFGDPSQI